jgi:hypothetical protein
LAAIDRQSCYAPWRAETVRGPHGILHPAWSPTQMRGAA